MITLRVSVCLSVCCSALGEVRPGGSRAQRAPEPLAQSLTRAAPGGNGLSRGVFINMNDGTHNNGIGI